MTLENEGVLPPKGREIHSIRDISYTAYQVWRFLFGNDWDEIRNEYKEIWDQGPKYFLLPRKKKKEEPPPKTDEKGPDEQTKPSNHDIPYSSGYRPSEEGRRNGGETMPENETETPVEEPELTKGYVDGEIQRLEDKLAKMSKEIAEIKTPEEFIVYAGLVDEKEIADASYNIKDTLVSSYETFKTQLKTMQDEIDLDWPELAALKKSETRKRTGRLTAEILEGFKETMPGLLNQYERLESEAQNAEKTINKYINSFEGMEKTVKKYISEFTAGRNQIQTNLDALEGKYKRLEGFKNGVKKSQTREELAKELNKDYFSPTIKKTKNIVGKYNKFLEVLGKDKTDLKNYKSDARQLRDEIKGIKKTAHENVADIHAYLVSETAGNI